MRRQELQYAKKYIKRRGLRSIWKKFAGFMASVVVFATTYALILPAITQEVPTGCGLQEHVHEEACYVPGQEQLICQLETQPVHTHGAACYETVTHTHADACYQMQQGDLLCQNSEEGHLHNSDCYGWVSLAVCGLEEGTEEQQLTCQEPETAAHVHEESCYEISVQLICAEAEHTHALACYSDPAADRESAKDWEKTMAGVELTGVWADDLLAIANSQLGYRESKDNYIVLSDGVSTRGYTRYGDWYGSSYGDWCAMFVSFCLHYAGVEDVPLDAHCQNWIDTLTERGMYAPAAEHTPIPGDLIFFDWENNGTANHVGIVEAIENGAVKTIEGNSNDRVASKTYEITDSVITGYGILPEYTEPVFTLTAQIYTDGTYQTLSDDATVIILTGAIPEDAEVRAFPVTLETEAEVLCAYDITIFLPDGSVFEPGSDNSITVTFQTEALTGVDSEENIDAYYIPEEGTPEPLDAAVTDQGICFDADHFSTYAILRLTEGIREVPIAAVNYYAYNIDGFGSVIFHSDSGTTVAAASEPEKDFLWWYAIVVERVDGYFRVTEIDDRMGVSKADIYASGNGFILLYHDATLGATVAVEVGDYVTLSDAFWKTTAAYSSTPHGTVTFSADIPSQQKTEKDNSNQLTVVEGADTDELIEINLYNYNAAINTLYKSNYKYPGFQQDNGTTSLTGSGSLGANSFNFGNNITADLAAGIASLTGNSGNGVINTTAKDATYGTANVPVSGAMNPLLLDGYPALADGTGLGYLFSDSTYAEKVNTAGINGLFLYDPATGAYSFNSRENHAQFDPDSNTFTLYKQLISSNFMMYPFGNFLPFNDITKRSAQASAIDRAYLQEIAQNAQYKYNQGYGDEYSTLYTQLTRFISMMDQKYGTGWDAYDAINGYFSAANLNAAFGENAPTLDDGTPILDAVYSIDYDEETNFFFGMEMEMSFYQSRDGKTGPNYDQDMVFYFTGDDDVWIYVDDVLFLDLSGIHRHVGGKIDFAQGKIYYYGLDTGTGDVAQTPYRTVSFAEAFREAYTEGSSELADALSGLNAKGTFTDYSTHTLRFYYMERGAGSGICRTNFNFPLVQQNTIQVSKELTVDENVAVLGNPDYAFQVLAAETDSLFIPAGTPYTLYDTDGSLIQQVKLSYHEDGSVREQQVVDAAGNILEESLWKTTDSNGVFRLKAGQTAVFVGIDETAGTYYVRELLDGVTLPQYGQITVSGQATTQTQDQVTVGSEAFTGVDSPIKDAGTGSTIFYFENRADGSKLGKLAVEKNVVGSVSGERSFDIRVTLDGQPLPAGTAYKVLRDGTEVRTDTVTFAPDGSSLISLAADEKAVLENILAGTRFVVSETGESAAGYTVSYAGEDDADVSVDENAASGRIRVETAAGIVVSNLTDGAQLHISGTKRVVNPDGAERIFTFRLTQVAAADDLTQIGEPMEETVTVGEDPVNFDFWLIYTNEQIGTYYYTVTEVDDLETGAEANFQTYLIQVTVTTDSDGKPAADITGIWCDGAASSEIAFVNTLVDQLVITKTLGDYSIQGNPQFAFTIELEAGKAPLSDHYPVIHSADAEMTTLEFTEGKAMVYLRDGESLTISNLPVGTWWTVTEAADCYTVSTGGIHADGPVVEGIIIQGGSTAEYINYAYELPESGGTGTTLYTIAGLTLIFSAALALYMIQRRKEGSRY